ncbi:MAG: DUF1285 domain-containing protein [Gluconacetobacter diazotrophicus]|nr:DUF1285 domain-containing protein [Gluconacetobacter diazotrophicus]
MVQHGRSCGSAFAPEAAIAGRELAGRDGAGAAGRTEFRTVRDLGSLPFHIRRDGTWLYKGTPILRKPMICLFASALRRGADGRYRIETPAERGFIDVEDAPFIVEELHWSGTGQAQALSFRLNTDEMVCAGPEHPLEVAWRGACRVAFAEGASAAIPYLAVRAGDGALPVQARVSRPVYYELMALAVEGSCSGTACMGVWSRHRFFPVGPLPDLDHGFGDGADQGADHGMEEGAGPAR